MNSYQPGNNVTLSVQFNTLAGVAVDPTAIALRVVDPNGIETDYTYAASQVTKIGVGSYSCMIPVLTSGYWNYRWEGTGAVYAAMESRFLVAQTAFTNPQ